jgi:quercetin dioxygenase-like cupin family protein
VILRNAEGWSGEDWFVGPWNSRVPAAIAFGGRAASESHVHDAMYEAYLVACGSATLVVDQAEHHISAGMIVIVEPGEAHHFASKSDDFRHFVVQTPFVEGDKRKG